MTTTFSEPPCDFGANDEASSRYTKQLAALEQRCLSASKDAQSWRLMTFGMTGMAVAAAAVCLYVASLQPTPAVHLVEIDSKTGETVRQQVIGEPISINDVMVSHMIGRWIQLTRGKSIDPVVLKSHWEQAYQFVPVEAKALIDAYAREIDAFNPKTITKEAVTVDITSVTRQSDKSFQVRWRETLFESGRRHGQQSFTANISVAFLKPTTPRQIQVNPIGLMITEIYVQPDFETGERSL
jgi:type IV secretion system protein VirB5